MFSAAWRPEISPALTLWTLTDLILVTSPYAIAEAKRNLDDPDALERLVRLIQQTEIVDEAGKSASLPEEIALVAKDRPILLAAIHSKCSHLLTGDRTHFGHLAGPLAVSTYLPFATT